MAFVKKYFAAIIFGLLIIGASFFVGFYSGESHAIVLARPDMLANTSDGKPSSVDFSPFWKTWNTLIEKYVATHGTTTEKVSDQDKVWGAIQGLVASLGDPYTVFFPPAESQIFSDEISGNFEGVGMEIDVKGDILTVVSPLKGTPAAKSGILAGDQILLIDGRDTSSMSVDEAVELIRGPVGSKVVFTIGRSGEKQPITISVIRDVIDIPTVETKKLPGGVFDIQLYSFSANSPTLFRNALRVFLQSDSDKLIIDVRGNPGGYLDAAIDMTSWFLPAGDVIVREDFAGKGNETVYRSKGYNIFTNKLKLVILVDGGSASASEILAGALKEHGVATLVGNKTFGKGSVQELVPITSDTSLKVTVARWLTPNGLSISDHGLTPDIYATTTADQFKSGQDPALDAAVKFLTK